MKNKTTMEPENNNFEIELLKALKSYGLLFPSSVKGVDRFEELYGQTEIELPERLNSSSNMLRKQSAKLIGNVDFKKTIRQAALVSKNKSSIGLSSFLTDEEIANLKSKGSDTKDAEKKRDKKKK